VSNGVSFDINGDGVKDQVAWTTSNDGISTTMKTGTIENGTELFTPTLADICQRLAALASLDSNVTA
jgi:hypothetical protein